MLHIGKGLPEAPLPGAPALPPLLLDAKASAALIGVGESTFWKLHSSARTPSPVRLGGRVVRWRRKELEAWVRAGCPVRHKWVYRDEEKA